MRIAIDGPAGAGKSTIARRLAKILGYVYVDTGAMYRALTYAVLEKGADPEDEEAVVNILEDLDLRLLPFDGQGQIQVYIGEKNVSKAIRTPEVSQSVSAVASHPKVRKVMVDMQQRMAKDGCVVMDGRDIGTTVIPDAELKIFLQASVEERAKRRSLELVRQGYQVDLKELERDIARRDFLDSNREVSPLRKADDAVEIDTTELTIDEVVEIILGLVTRRKSNV